MGTLVDWQITQLARDHHMIEPFETEKITTFGPSAGLSSAGYDITITEEWWTPRPGSDVVDLKTITRAEMDELYDKTFAPSFVIMPHSFVLCVTKEYFRIPRWLIGKVAGKSTLRRVAFLSDVTPLEPGWHGELVVELNSTFPRPIRVHAGMGVCQVMFERLDAEPEKDYVQRGAKYQNQVGITPAFI